MSTFAISSSLINSPLVKRATTHEDKQYLTGEKTGKGPTKKHPPLRHFNRKYQKSPDREVSWKRRRKLASKSIALPTEICDLFTEGERATLNIIANVVKENKTCDWSLDKIAAIAGVCRRTVQNAISKARDAGLVSVQLRPVRGRKNLTNVIRIVNELWQSWLKRVRSSFNLAIGCKMMHPTGENIYNRSNIIKESVPFSTTEALFDGLMSGKKPDD